MSDITTSLPIRTENNGDIKSAISDGTIPSQLLGVDASGRITIKLDDGSGNLISSQANGAQRALDVGINVLGVQVDPRAVRPLTSADVITAAQGAASTAGAGWFVRPGDGTNSQAYLATGEAKVAVTQSLPSGSASIGKVAQDNTVQWVTSDLANGSVNGGIAGTKSMLSGGVYNSALPTLTDGQQAAVQLDSSARQIIAPLTNASVVKAQLQDDAGNALTSSAAGSKRPLDTALRDSSGNLYTPLNPFPVQVTSDVIGDEIHDSNTASNVAAGASSNHDLSVTALKTFKATKFWASASGKMKIEIQTSTDGVAFVSRFVAFNSTANPNISIDLGHFTLNDTGVGAMLRIIRTNKETLTAQNLYSTISGVEI